MFTYRIRKQNNSYQDSLYRVSVINNNLKSETGGNLIAINSTRFTRTSNSVMAKIFPEILIAGCNLIRKVAATFSAETFFPLSLKKKLQLRGEEREKEPFVLFMFVGCVLRLLL